jgi:hypothetical protein
MPASSESVVRSPRDAAMGVATLSGLILQRLEHRTTRIMILPAINCMIYHLYNKYASDNKPKTKEANAAVRTLLEQRRKP